jgi:GT2 family glycosyltransferase
MGQLKASIIIPVWNGRQYLPACLDALAAQDDPDFEVIVVDNASSDGSADLVGAGYPAVRLVRNETNRGFAGGCNAGIKVATGDVLVLLNQDTRVLAGWLPAIREAFTDPRVGVVGCKALQADGQTVQHAGGWLEWPLALAHHRGGLERDEGQWDTPGEVEYVTGAAMAIRRGVVESIGLLDEEFWPGYYEDADFCFRAREAGYQVCYTPQAVLVHGETTSVKDPVLLSRYYQRGRVRFVLKHTPPQRLLETFVPAEIAYQPPAVRGRESSALPLAYLEAIPAIPLILRRRWQADERAVTQVIAAFRQLYAAAWATDLQAVEERAAAAAPGGSAAEAGAGLQEITFRSDRRMVGPVIARFRTLWYNVAARWGVRHLALQQEAINQSMKERLLRLSEESALLAESMAGVRRGNPAERGVGIMGAEDMGTTDAGAAGNGTGRQDAIPADLIEISDPEIYAAQIMAEIRERVRKRREQLGYAQRAFPAFSGTGYPEPPDDIPYNRNLYHHLRLVNETYADVETGASLPPSGLARAPIVGPLWQRIRVYLHTLVLFYVNRAVAQQTDVHRHTISVINELTALSQTQERAIAALRAEVEALRPLVGRAEKAESAETAEKADRAEI